MYSFSLSSYSKLEKNTTNQDVWGIKMKEKFIILIDGIRNKRNTL